MRINEIQRINQGIRTVFILALFLSLVVPGHAQAAGDPQGVVVAVRALSTINSSRIALGDIARVEAPPGLKQVLEELDAGFGPDFGETKILDGSRLESKIRSFRYLPEDSSVSVPETVYIKRAGQEISEADLHDFFVRFVEERLGRADIDIREFNARGMDMYPAGELSLTPSSRPLEELIGRVSLTVTVRVDGRDCGNVYLSGWVDVFETVVCASRNLRRGEILSAGDWRTERRNISRFHGDWMSPGEPIQGMVLKRGIKQGSPISMIMLEEAPLVKAGDRVTLISVSGTLRIVASGIAKSDGRKNEQIWVENTDSSREVYGVVTGASTVEVRH